MNTGHEDLTAFEAEHLVQKLEKLELNQVGGAKFLHQHELLERLNVQAHLNVQAQVFDFVSESLVSEEKISIILHSLLLSSVWRRSVFPKLKTKLVAADSLSAYFLLYHEATLVNLLELVAYNSTALTQLGDELLDLIEYCTDKINNLITLPSSSQNVPTSASDSGKDIRGVADEMLAVGDEERFDDSIREMDFQICISCISILRYISDCAPDLSLGILEDILNDRDLICTLVILLEKSPWIRKRPTKANPNQLERFEAGVWHSLASEDDLQIVGKVEAQIWLALMNLCLTKECRQKYNYTTKNQAIILRLKNYISEETVDQIPPLVDLQRYLEELTIMTPPDYLQRSGIRPMTNIVDNILNGVDLQALAKEQLDSLTSRSPKEREMIASKLAKMYDIDGLESLLEDPKCAKCGSAAANRCSSCKSEWYCSRECQVAAWKAHKDICKLLASAQELDLQKNSHSSEGAKITTIN